MEEQTQTTQDVQDETVSPVEDSVTPTSTEVTQQEATSVAEPSIETTPVEQTPDTTSTETIPAPVDEVAEEPKKLTGADVLASYGLVEIYDARLGAFCQVKKEDAEKMLQSLEALKTALGV